MLFLYFLREGNGWASLGVVVCGRWGLGRGNINTEKGIKRRQRGIHVEKICDTVYYVFR